MSVAAALIALAEIQTAAEAGPGPLENWIISALLGGLFACIHIALKDQVLNLANRVLAFAARGQIEIPGPTGWEPPTDRQVFRPLAVPGRGCHL